MLLQIPLQIPWGVLIFNFSQCGDRPNDLHASYRGAYEIKDVEKSWDGVVSI